MLLQVLITQRQPQEIRHQKIRPRYGNAPMIFSTLIDFLTTHSTWREHVDEKRIGVLGFSLGGAAAMELVGATASLEDYA